MPIRTREQRFDLFITVLTCFLFLNLFDNDSEGFRRHLSSNYLQYFATSTLLSQNIHVDLECLQLVVGVHTFALDTASSRCAATDGLQADPVPGSD
jgi:hypothetical protein